MSTAKRRPIKRLALAVGLLVSVGAWILLSLKPSDNASQVITEQWVQICYDPDSPDTGMDGDVTIVTFLDCDSADCRDAAVALSSRRLGGRQAAHVPSSTPRALAGHPTDRGVSDNNRPDGSVSTPSVSAPT